MTTIRLWYKLNCTAGPDHLAVRAQTRLGQCQETLRGSIADLIGRDAHSTLSYACRLSVHAVSKDYNLRDGRLGRNQ
jgi:transcription initiation factor TFIID subunit TAF12